MSNDIGTEVESKEKNKHYLSSMSLISDSSVVSNIYQPEPTGLSVDSLMAAAFFNGRAPRSAEYKAGTRMALEHRVERKDIVPPYQAGTAAADAFFAGIDEGKSIWRAAVAKIGGAA